MHTTQSNITPTLTINLSELPCRETVEVLESAAARFDCSIEWHDGGMWVWGSGRDLLFDCFLITLSEALPLIRPHWDLSIDSIGEAA